MILEKTLPEHRVSALIYLNYNQTWDEYVNYSPAHMVQWCGYSPNWRSRKNSKLNIYEKFRICMEWYWNNGYIFDFDVEKYVQNNFQSSLLNKERILPKGNFGTIYDFELSAIKKYMPTYRPLNRSVLLLLLAYIRAFTWNRSTQTTGHSVSSKKRKPEIFHSQFKTMGEYIGINAKLISKATEILESLGIITTHRMPSYQDRDGVWHTDDIIYVFKYKFITEKRRTRICSQEEYDPQKELEYGIQFLRECKYSSKKFYQM